MSSFKVVLILPPLRKLFVFSSVVSGEAALSVALAAGVDALVVDSSVALVVAFLNIEIHD